MRIINLDRRKGKSVFLLKKAQRTGSIILTPSAATKAALIKLANETFGEGNWNITILTLYQYKSKNVDYLDDLKIFDAIKNKEVYILIDDLDIMLPKILSDYLKGYVSDVTTTIYMTNNPPHDED